MLRNIAAHVGHVHNVNNAALRGADLTFVFWLHTPTGCSDSRQDRQQMKDKEPLCTSVNVSC